MKKILLGLGLILSFVFGIDEANITNHMQIKIDDITTILKNKELPKEDKRTKLFHLLDDVFDFELMARLSLGRAFNNMSKSEQDEFIKVFVHRLKNSYLDKIDLYNGEEIFVRELTKVKADRITLLTQVVGVNENYDIVYKFYSKENDWLIYDIDIIGVSIVQTYRKQFSEFLATKSTKDLINDLKSNK
ncbi:MlaC/ttg2D family ABC transporter substrate-binding protein [Arcobacter sp. FWKO B]|uniref:MlaC/ttg2D family ABC transporter substrate-binding protein n=1 Tax=Arcobacter sp. FWKO B TaxID=2593672 RepID=UPI0018A5E2B1|nr:ABC transporter substrate-binding protein [Arcobacter sp. FWKO B]QOG11947.1 ABC transporter substrate-binding protein [Arcobacter sp. FWKO B]